MTITAASVSGSPCQHDRHRYGQRRHLVPAEGLAVVLSSALTLASGMVVGPTAPGSTVVIFQQPPPSIAADVV